MAHRSDEQSPLLHKGDAHGRQDESEEVQDSGLRKEDVCVTNSDIRSSTSPKRMKETREIGRDGGRC